MIKEKVNLTQSKRGYLLRISVSDVCNYDCMFCHPPKNEDKNVLSHDDLMRIVTEVNKIYKLKTIHFTGGEPLMRSDLIKTIEGCRAIVDSDVDIAITTNGALISGKVNDLASAGLTRMNVSLHSLKQE